MHGLDPPDCIPKSTHGFHKTIHVQKLACTGLWIFKVGGGDSNDRYQFVRDKLSLTNCPWRTWHWTMGQTPARRRLRSFLLRTEWDTYSWQHILALQTVRWNASTKHWRLLWREWQVTTERWSTTCHHYCCSKHSLSINRWDPQQIGRALRNQLSSLRVGDAQVLYFRII